MATTIEINALNTKQIKLHAWAEIRAEFQGLFNDVTERLARIDIRLTEAGAADTDLTQTLLDEVLTLKGKIVNGLNNIKTTHYTLITGEDA
jgi:hypothetical protein